MIVEQEIYKFFTSYFDIIKSEMIDRYLKTIVDKNLNERKNIETEAMFFTEHLFSKQRIDLLYKAYETYYRLRGGDSNADVGDDFFEEDNRAHIERVLFEYCLYPEEIEKVIAMLKKQFGEQIIMVPKPEHSMRNIDGN